MAKRKQKKGQDLARSRHVDGLKIPTFSKAGRSITTTQEVGPEDAQRILNKDNFAGQRRLDKSMVHRLANAMWRGKFLECSQIRLAALGGRRILVDGQHRLAAVVKSGTTQRFVITVTPVSSVDAIRSLYADIDQGRVRSYFEVYKSLDLNGKLGIKNFDISKIGSAGPHVIGGFSQKLVHAASKIRDLRTAFIEDYAGEAKVIIDAIQGAPVLIRNKIMMGPVFSVALVTATYKPRKSAEFWGKVADPSGLDTRDPRFRLRDYLLADDARRRRPVEWSHLTANAWNAFYTGRLTKTLFVKDPRKNIRLLACKNYGGTDVHLPYGNFMDPEWRKPKWEAQGSNVPCPEDEE